jgi:hypothetical protein
MGMKGNAYKVLAGIPEEPRVELGVDGSIILK